MCPVHLAGSLVARRGDSGGKCSEVMPIVPLYCCEVLGGQFRMGFWRKGVVLEPWAKMEGSLPRSFCPSPCL